MFWINHDSTKCHSRQYMSAIFYNDEEQKQLAEQTRLDHQAKIKKTVVTKILPAQTFYDAEDYHQKFMLRQCPSLLQSLNLSPEELKHSTAAAFLNGFVGGFASLGKAQENFKRLNLSEEQVNMITKLFNARY